MAMPGAHVAGIPIEETVALYGPLLLLVLSATSAAVGFRLRRVRERRRAGQRQEPALPPEASDLQRER
jgi:hypothetical protein